MAALQIKADIVEESSNVPFPCFLCTAPTPIPIVTRTEQLFVCINCLSATLVYAARMYGRAMTRTDSLQAELAFGHIEPLSKFKQELEELLKAIATQKEQHPEGCCIHGRRWAEVAKEI